MGGEGLSWFPLSSPFLLSLPYGPYPSTPSALPSICSLEAAANATDAAAAARGRVPTGQAANAPTGQVAPSQGPDLPGGSFAGPQQALRPRRQAPTIDDEKYIFLQRFVQRFEI